MEAFVERIERRLAEAEAVAAPRPARIDLRLPLISFALGIGATAVATSNAPGAGGIVIACVAWLAIAVVNVLALLLGVATSFFRR